MATSGISLTDQQHAAVIYDGNLSLTACPGSGKTRTLSAKLVREIEPLRGTPRAVACITYTNSAVQEIEQRAATLIEPADEIHFAVSTIHSFCLNNILRPFAWRAAGFSGAPVVLTRDKPIFDELVRYACGQVNYGNVTRAEYDAFENLNVNAAGQLVGVALTNEIVKRAARYFWARCNELGYIDFCSIIYKSYCLVRDHRDIRMSLSARYAWFLIDEFQDTSVLQIELLKLIYSTNRSRFLLLVTLRNPYTGLQERDRS